MNFFLWDSGFARWFAHVADLSRSGDQIENSRADLAVVQNNLGSTKHAHRFDSKEIGISWTSSHQIDFTFHGWHLCWMQSPRRPEPTALFAVVVHANCRR